MNPRFLHRVALMTLPIYGFGVSYQALAAAGLLPEQPVDLTPPAVFIASSAASTATTTTQFVMLSPITGDEVKAPPPQGVLFIWKK